MRLARARCGWSRPSSTATRRRASSSSRRRTRAARGSAGCPRTRRPGRSGIRARARDSRGTRRSPCRCRDRATPAGSRRPRASPKSVPPSNRTQAAQTTSEPASATTMLIAVRVGGPLRLEALREPRSLSPPPDRFLHRCDAIEVGPLDDLAQRRRRREGAGRRRSRRPARSRRSRRLRARSLPRAAAPGGRPADRDRAASTRTARLARRKRRTWRAISSSSSAPSSPPRSR